MLVEVHSQIPFADKGQHISPVMRRIVRQVHWSSITGIFAYATASGLLELLSATESLTPTPSLRWLFGLDDCLTEPGAIDLARDQGGIVSVASFLHSGRRFHPKVLHFTSHDNNADAAIIGSSNLTLSGLTKNAEAISILHAESDSDVRTLRNLVSSLYRLGHEPTGIEIEEYRKAYKAARPYHRKVVHLTQKALKLQPKPKKAPATLGTGSASPGIDCCYSMLD